ncbi:MAG: leucine-rich repeat protein, partial [Clostridia bacterium]|nr:leucine-rich repeat protein [Clostridia bacterium]
MKHTKRLFLAVIFTAVLILCAALPASADDASYGGMAPHVYRENVSDEFFFEGSIELSPVMSEDLSKYGSYEDAVAALRQGLSEHKAEVTVYVKSNARADYEYMVEMFYAALEHTGVPNEGDYLRYNCGGSSFGTRTITLDGSYYIGITFTPVWYTTAAQEAEVDRAIDEVIASLNLNGMSEYQKIRTLYDYVTGNVDYDYDNLNDDEYMLKYTTYAAIINKTAVCQGFATLYYRLCLTVGIDARVISGDAGGPHGWNIVKLGDVYYNMDPTWDCNLSVFYRYFLCTDGNFQGHTRDEEYDTAGFHAKYPMAKVPYVENITASGTLSNGMKWSINGDSGTLTITGNGDMPDFKNQGAPWFPYHENIQSVVLNEGITSVGKFSFVRCKYMTSATLPSTLKVIKNSAFNNCRSLVSITFPSGLTTIETSAFAECTALREIVIPESVKTFGTSVFSHCYSLNKVTLAEGLTSIPDSMFYNCDSLTTINFPSTLKSIEDTVFRDCDGFTSIHIPSHITSLGYAVFGNCKSLTNITVDGANPTFASVDGVLFTKDLKTLVCYPAGRPGSYTVPDGTVTIGEASFCDNAKLTDVVIPASVKRIETYAFTWCYGLKSFTLPQNIEFVGSYAFGFCEYMTSFTFTNPNTVVDTYCFSNCVRLKNVALPANLKEIPFGMFASCEALQSIDIPDGVTKIGQTSFYGCKMLTTVTLPSSVTVIEPTAFRYCTGITDFYILGNIKGVGRCAFENCPALTFMYIGGSFNSVDSTAFEDTDNITVIYFASSSTAASVTKNTVFGEMLKNAKSIAIPVAATATAYIKNNYAVITNISFGLNDYVLYSNHNCSWTADGTVSTSHGTLSTQKCTTCNAKKNGDPVIHIYKATETVNPTCYSEGYTVYKCTLCEKSYKDDYTDMLPHIFGDPEEFDAPGCNTNRIMGKYCTVCGSLELYEEEGSALGHSLTEYRESATCISSGFYFRWCTRCDYEETPVELPQLPHTIVVIPGKAPSCTESGLTDEKYCSECYCTFEISTEIPATGHTFTAWTVTLAPTCTENGAELGTCHCGETESRTVPATGHTFGEWIIVKQPTCTENGTETSSCHCGESETHDIPETGHSLVKDTPVAPSCTNSGLTEGEHCTVCGTVTIPQETIPETGHSLVKD